MRIYRDAESIAHEIESSRDPLISKLLAARVHQGLEYQDEDNPEWLLSVIVVEPGDTLADLNPEANGELLANAWSGTKYFEPNYRPPCETLEEYPTFYELLFVLSDWGNGLSLIVPKEEGIDPDLLTMCKRWATPAEEIPE